MRLRLLVAYDGSGFRGFARSEGVATVQGAVEGALSQVFDREVSVVAAGRTDAGVHAWGQVVSFDAPDGTDPGQVRHALTSMLGPAVVIRAADQVAPTFDARHSATWRAYRYTIVNRQAPDPFLARTAWWIPYDLDLSMLRLACDPLIGTHDFSSFCRRPVSLPDGRERSLTRRVIDARWHDLGDGLLRFDISAASFCHQMVRSIVGTMVDVGKGKLRAGEMAGALAARDRSKVGMVAPAGGLCLWEVGY